MTVPKRQSIASELAESYQRRFPRWDAALWEDIVELPAEVLAMGLADADHADANNAKVMTAYLELAAEAVGLGYIYPMVSVGRENFFTFAWFDLLPHFLSDAPPRRRLDILADCWNLGENLEQAAPWVQRILLSKLRQVEDLTQLRSAVNRIMTDLMSEPMGDLTLKDNKVILVDPTGVDPRFMPGRIEFVAPTVAVVYDRHRGLDEKPRATLGIWLCDPPLILGQIQTSGGHSRAELHTTLWKTVQKTRPEVDDILDSARNRWRGVASLRTSQLLVVLMPEVGQ